MTFIFYTMEAHMRNLIIIPVLLFSLCFGAPSYSADLSKGEIAYQNGDYATALKELMPLAEQGDAKAQWRLGWMFDYGDGILPEDDKQAVRWYTLAAEQGYAKAQHNLGQMYHFAEGVPKDDKEAVRWYTLAAEQGYANAQMSLSEIAYQNGDYATAVKELIPLAEQGHPQAQYNLGLFYAKGEGVIQDYVKAYMWWNIVAEETGHDSAKNNIKVLEEHYMTVFQIADAQTRSTLCVKNNYKGC
jgi:TPR repeat protein